MSSHIYGRFDRKWGNQLLNFISQGQQSHYCVVFNDHLESNIMSGLLISAAAIIRNKYSKHNTPTIRFWLDRLRFIIQPKNQT